MKRFRLSPEAAGDVREIWAYIAEDSIKAARKVRLSLFEACKRLAEHPNIGHFREDLTDQRVLFWPVGSYLIIYDPGSLFPLSESFMVLAKCRAFCDQKRVLA